MMDAPPMPPPVERAIAALECSGQSAQRLLIADFTRSSKEKRLLVVDMTGKRPRIVGTEYVAHGSGSDPGRTGKATIFSNAARSLASSLGLYRVAERYSGKHGRSYRLDGLTPGYNDNARDRAVVMHTSAYAESGGRSWGCPAVSEGALKRIEKGGMEGTFLYIDAGKAFACIDSGKSQRSVVLKDGVS
jgi:hypothetical protein